MLVCPVCSGELEIKEKVCSCPSGHVFDRAKEGYVNLLSGRHKPGELIGDNKDMARARRNFLEKGYYDFLADALSGMIKKGKLLDISCGEGYYTDYLRRQTGCETYGFDISKEMIKLASKKYKDVTFFVANISKIPVETASVDSAVQICAPFSEKEFARILKNDGSLFSVVPAKRHLWGLKELLYASPYENEPDASEYEGLLLYKETVVGSNAFLKGNEDIMSLFAMTPYYYKTSENDKKKITQCEYLETELEFVIREYKKKV